MTGFNTNKADSCDPLPSCSTPNLTIAQLMEEKEDEIKHQDFCADEFDTNQLRTEKKEPERTDLIAKIEDLEMTIKALTESFDALKAEIAEMQLQMKRAWGDCEKQHT